MTTSPAWAQFWAAVLPALAAFLVAALGALAISVRNWMKVGALSTLLDAQSDRIDAQVPVQQIVAAPAGAGGTPLPLAAPMWNQLNDPLADGRQDPEASTDCGEECAAMAIAACGGPALPAGQLRALLGGSGRRGATTLVDLVYLLTLFRIRCHQRVADPDAAWVEWQHSFAAGYLIIALGFWVSPGYQHWVLVRSTTADELAFNDPWGGELRNLSKEEAQKLYCGCYVHIDQAISAPAPTPPAD